MLERRFRFNYNHPWRISPGTFSIYFFVSSTNPLQNKVPYDTNIRCSTNKSTNCAWLPFSCSKFYFPDLWPLFGFYWLYTEWQLLKRAIIRNWYTSFRCKLHKGEFTLMLPKLKIMKSDLLKPAANFQYGSRLTLTVC